MTHAVVLGATSSLAEALCQQLAQQGVELSLFGRDQEELTLLSSDLEIRFGNKNHIYPLDVTRLDEATQWKKTIGNLPPIDLVYLLIGTLPTKNTVDEIIPAINSNFTGPALLLLFFANKLKEQGGGKMAVVTSVAGDIARASNYLYGSVKSGVSHFAVGLRRKLWRDRVHIMLVKPGFIDTPMTYGMKSPLIASREYVVRKMIAALEKNQNEICIPFYWKYLILTLKLIPETIFKRLPL